jgi:hypothetical protein
MSRDQMMAAEGAWNTVRAADLLERNISAGTRITLQVELQDTGHPPALEVITNSGVGVGRGGSTERKWLSSLPPTA